MLISRTGGGHLAGANALSEAMLARDPDLEIEIVDGLVEAGVFPLPHMPKLYTHWSQHRNLWGAFFHATNGRIWSEIISYPLERSSRPAMRRLIEAHAPDLVVVLHPCLTKLTFNAIRKLPIRPQVVTVVTDLVYGHASWFSHGADRYFVPTEELHRIAVGHKIPESKLMISGFPLTPRLFQIRDQKQALRSEFGFERMTVVCVGGADGMGITRLVPHLLSVSSEIDFHIICGKNEPLFDQLQNQQLPTNFHLHEFIQNLPEMFAAADLALIKASPNSLMEAVTVGTRILIYNYLPGQEAPNVDFVIKNNLGECSRSPREIARKLDDLGRLWAKDGSLPVSPGLKPANGAEIIAEELLAPSQSQLAIARNDSPVS
jgi:1,2-diacylglycerol 3-beta-galactosyltransferase